MPGPDDRTDRGVPVVMAVNREYAGSDDPLQAATSCADPAGVRRRGGAAHVRLSAEPLTLDPLLAIVRDPRAGAVTSFLGVTRDVAALEYEAYPEMALEQLRAIVAGAIEEHGLCAAAAEHRTGIVALSEPSVAIAVSAPHREAAFAGARQIIDQIKALAPIWKKEEGEWVKGTTPS